MPVIAFDFDGVIADSRKETYVISKKIYEEMTDQEFISKKEFFKNRPYVKIYEDFFSLCLLVKSGKKIDFSSIKQMNEKHKKECKEFAKRSYAYRHFLMNNERKNWLKLFDFNPQVIANIKDLTKKSLVFIATTRDMRSVSFLLDHAKIKIKKENIITRDFSKNKIEQIDHISKLSSVPIRKIIMIDDIIDHLVPLHRIGVNTMLASWGYSTKEQLSNAGKLGIRIAKKDNLSTLLNSEYFDVINEKGNTIGRASREECHKKGLLHKASAMLIFNSKGEILIQKRSMKKDLNKGFLSVSCAGHVESGESFEETADRELNEELGVKTKLRKLFDLRINDCTGGHDNEIMRVFAGRHDGPFKINREELDFAKFFSLEQINQLMKKEKFTPATRAIFKKINQNPSILKSL